jgi:hypothetical protein
MIKELSKKKFKFLVEHNLLIPISRWETFDKAEVFYSRLDGNYFAYKENVIDLITAYSTPVRIYMIKDADHHIVSTI